MPDGAALVGRPETGSPEVWTVTLLQGSVGCTVTVMPTDGSATAVPFAGLIVSCGPIVVVVVFCPWGVPVAVPAGRFRSAPASRPT